MKRIIYEQQNNINVRRLSGDRTWEYGLKNGLWVARKQDGSGDWISIDLIDPGANDKVKNPKAVETLNNAFPDDKKLRDAAIAKLKGANTKPGGMPTNTQTGANTKPGGMPSSQVNAQMNSTTQTGAGPTSKKLDYNNRITFEANVEMRGNNTSDTGVKSIFLPKGQANNSKLIIDSLGLGDKMSADNSFKIPNNVRVLDCYKSSLTIFTKRISDSEYKEWCENDLAKPAYDFNVNQFFQKSGAIIIKWFREDMDKRYEVKNFSNTPKSIRPAVQETNLKSLIKKVLRESITPKIELKKKR